MRRRDFMAVLAAAAAWRDVARAQQTPVIGYLSFRSAESDVSMLAAFRRGLDSAGWVEGRNVAIEYRFADGQVDRVRALGMELTARRVAVIVVVGLIANEEVFGFMKASQIPIVFNTGADPVRYGLVSSLNRPGGNLTGINTLVSELTTKHVELLHDLVPEAKTIAALVDPGAYGLAEENEARRATAALGLRTLVLRAVNDSELDAVFAAVNRQGSDAMIVEANPFYVTRARQIAVLAARQRIPVIYPRREFAAAGGLISYGYEVADGYRLMGNYTGRVLNGEKPADLPVLQPTKFELVINLNTAKTLGLIIPETLLATADEVIQ